MKTQKIMFVHGMFVTPACWRDWQSHFEARGYQTLAPAWPQHDIPIADQRGRHPSAELGAVTLADLLARYREALRGLDEKPILIGHSMGGLIVQLLLQEGLGAAGIAIDSAPPKGVISLKYSFLKSNWPAISPFAKLREPISLSLDQFKYAFVNTLPPDQQQAAYDTQVVPESRQVGKGPTTDTAKIDFARARPPLLLIAGEKDHIIPASLNRDNFRKYAKSPSITEFKEFPGRDHWIIAETGWQEVADFALAWIQKNSR